MFWETQTIALYTVPRRFHNTIMIHSLFNGHSYSSVTRAAVAVLGKNIGGGAAGPSSFGRQQRLSEITFYTDLQMYYFTLM